LRKVRHDEAENGSDNTFHSAPDWCALRLRGCAGAGIGIQIAQIRRIQFISGFVGVATDQHYYGIYLSGDIAYPIKIEQLV